MMHGLSLGAVVFGGRLGIFENIGFEKLLVDFLGFVEGVGALCMELQGRLEQLQCIVDLREASVRLSPKENTVAHCRRTWSSLSVSVSSSMFSSASTLIAWKVGGWLSQGQHGEGKHGGRHGIDTMTGWPP